MGWFIFVAIIILFATAIFYSSSKIRENADNIKSENRNIDIWLFENNYHPNVDFSYNNMMHNVNARFMVDEQAKVVLLSKMGKLPLVTSFDKIIGCEIKENNIVTGGIGRAVVGGILAGGAGSIVGATTAKKYVDLYDIIIYTNDIQTPQIIIDLINSKELTDSANYINAVNFADKVNATIKAIIYNSSTMTKTAQ